MKGPDDGSAPPVDDGDDGSEAVEGRWTRPSAGPREVEFENALRPKRFSDFVGQERVLANLRIALEATRARGRSPRSQRSRSSASSAALE